MLKVQVCSFSVVTDTKCGANRGDDAIISLHECCHDMKNHLRQCHLSRENMTETDVILARAGLFDLDYSNAGRMKICPAHRNNLGRYWQPLRTCQYPEHVGKLKKVEGDNVINLKMSKDIFAVFRTTVQVGSREYSSI